MSDLAKIIRENPGAVVVLDNDCFWLRPARPKPQEQMTAEEHDQWADSEDLFGGFNSDPRDLLNALAVLSNITIEPV